MILKKSIGLYIFLSIITCGLFALYWLVSMANDLNEVSGEQGTAGGVVLLLTIITCGIYGWYWLYMAGQKIRIAQTKRNFPYVTDSSVIYIVLAVVGLSIVSYALIQNELNKISEYDMSNNNQNIQ